MNTIMNSERERLLLWLPVGLAAGMLLYFSLRVEPSSYALFPLLGLPVLCRWTWRYGYGGLLICAVIAGVIAMGFVAAKLASDRHHMTLLKQELRFVTVRGTLQEIGDEAGGKWKLTLDKVEIEGLAPEQTPQRVRVSYRGDASHLLTGDRIELRAGLLPPSGPVMPGAFDFARYFYFKGIGGVGYAIPPLKPIAVADVSSFQVWQAQLRQQLSNRIRLQMPPVEGAITAALMMGDRAAIPEDVNQAMRNSNLSHILSISGLHMVIVCGLVFLVMRYCLLIPRYTRNLLYGKKIAAAFALLVGGAYLMISGMPPSAVRAYIMVAFLFGAVLLDRQVMPMRSLALAAVLMLLWWPPYVLDPGFQLSFLATAALIAWYEWIRARADRMAGPQDWWRRIALYAGGIMMSSLIAESVTMPLVLYHFNSVSFYGVLANLLVSPLVSFLIMPGIIAAFVLMPFGLEGWALLPVGYGVSAMVAIAQWVAAIPYAQSYVRAMPGWGVSLMILGMVWLMLWQRRVRLLGLAMVAVGALSWLSVRTPDMMISHDGKQVAGRIAGELVVLRGRAQSFIPSQWANLNGMEMLPYAAKDAPTWRCDERGCIWEKRVAISEHQSSLPDDCAQVQAVVAPYRMMPRDCKGVRRVDYDQLKRGGNHWAWVDGDVLRWGNTATLVGQRPWSR